MTKTQFRKKTRILKKRVNELIEKEVEIILNSGCLNLKDSEDDFQLPKAFMCAIGKDINFQFEPIDKKGRKEAENIGLFL